MGGKSWSIKNCKQRPLSKTFNHATSKIRAYPKIFKLSGNCVFTLRISQDLLTSCVLDSNLADEFSVEALPNRKSSGQRGTLCPLPAGDRPTVYYLWCLWQEGAFLHVSIFFL